MFSRKPERKKGMGKMIRVYDESFRGAWDKFVLKESCNGTFQQTRNFLSYHPPGRFRDHSLMFFKGQTVMAVLPAHIAEEDGGGRMLLSHEGCTFGGIVLGRDFKKIADIESVLEELTAYARENGFTEIRLKMTGGLYAREPVEALDYFLQQYGFHDTMELGFYIDLEGASPSGVTEGFSASRRRDLRKALQNGMTFRELEGEGEIREFYGLLEANMRKFSRRPVHTLEELLDFKRERLKDIVSFYGVFYEGQMIAGGMAFDFGQGQVFHLQYLASDRGKLELFPNEFLYYSMINNALGKHYRRISFGTSTLEQGRVLNRSLALFKSGFGTEMYVNRTYHWVTAQTPTI